MQPSGRQERKMTYYQQTLLIPKPRQRLEDSRRSSGPGYRRTEPRNAPNRDLNTILAFFD